MDVIIDYYKLPTYISRIVEAHKAEHFRNHGEVNKCIYVIDMKGRNIVHLKQKEHLNKKIELIKFLIILNFTYFNQTYQEALQIRCFTCNVKLFLLPAFYLLLWLSNSIAI